MAKSGKKKKSVTVLVVPLTDNVKETAIDERPRTFLSRRILVLHVYVLPDEQGKMDAAIRFDSVWAA